MALGSYLFHAEKGHFAKDKAELEGYLGFKFQSRYPSLNVYYRLDQGNVVLSGGNDLKESLKEEVFRAKL